MAQRIQRRIRELTGQADPYRAAKEHQNRTALELVERFSPQVASAANGLELAVRLAIAGNVIDLNCPLGRMVLRASSSLSSTKLKPSQAPPAAESLTVQEPIMEIVVTASGPTLDADVDPRFARCAYYLFVDAESGEFESLQNTGEAESGAGIKAAQRLASKNAGVVLTGNCGPNAFRTLSAAGIPVVLGCAGLVREVIERYRAGQLRPASEPDVQAHSGTSGAVPSQPPAPQSPAPPPSVPPQDVPLSPAAPVTTAAAEPSSEDQGTPAGRGMGSGMGRGWGGGRRVGGGPGRGQGGGRGRGRGRRGRGEN